MFQTSEGNFPLMRTLSNEMRRSGWKEPKRRFTKRTLYDELVKLVNLANLSVSLAACNIGDYSNIDILDCNQSVQPLDEAHGLMTMKSLRNTSH